MRIATRRFRTSIPVNNAASCSTVIIGGTGQPKLPMQPLDLVGKPVAILVVAGEVGEVLNPSQPRRSLTSALASTPRIPPCSRKASGLNSGSSRRAASSAQITNPSFQVRRAIRIREVNRYPSENAKSRGRA